MKETVLIVFLVIILLDPLILATLYWLERRAYAGKPMPWDWIGVLVRRTLTRTGETPAAGKVEL